jgi:uncharacterized membrane protein YoaK (UPF0700 family)
VSAPDPLARLRTEAAGDLRHPLTVTLLALTVITGVIDAVSYLGLGHVFAANMTGNVVLLGFGLAGSGGLPVVAPIVSLVAFLVGAGVGGRLAARYAGRHHVHIKHTLAAETLLTLAALALTLVLNVRAGRFSGDVLIAVLAFSMGIRNATVRRIAVPDLTTTVLTLTLTGLAADSRLAGGSGRGTARRVAAAVTMLLGALAGALLLKVDLAVPLAAAAGLTLALWFFYPRLAPADVA